MTEERRKNPFCPQHDMVMAHHQKIGELSGKIDIYLQKQENVFKDISDIKVIAAENATSIGHLIGKVTTLCTSGSVVVKKTRLPGLAGFLNKAWDDFADKIGWIVIALCLWLLLWAFTKSAVFHEVPYWIGG